MRGCGTANNNKLFVEVDDNVHVSVNFSIENLRLGGRLVWRKISSGVKSWVGRCHTTQNYNMTCVGLRISKFDVKIKGDCRILCTADIKWGNVEYNDSGTYSFSYRKKNETCTYMKINIIVQETKLKCHAIHPNTTNYVNMSCEWIAQHHYNNVEFRLGNRTGLNESTLHTIASSDDALCLNKAPHKCTLSGFSVEKSCQFFNQPKVEKLHDGENSSVSFRCCAHETSPRLWLYEKSSDHSFHNVVGQSFLIEEDKISGCDSSVIIVCGEETNEGNMMYGFLKLVVNSSFHIEVSSSNGTNMTNDTIGSERLNNAQCNSEYVFDILAYPAKDKTTLSTDDGVYSFDITEFEQSTIWTDESFTDQQTTTTVIVLTQFHQSNCSEVYSTNGSHQSVLNNHPHVTITVQITLIIAILAFIFSMWTPVKQCYSCLKERTSCSIFMHNDGTFVDGGVYPLTQNLNSDLSAERTLPSESPSPFPENRFCQVGTEDQENIGMNGIRSQFDSIISLKSSRKYLDKATQVERGEDNTDLQADSNDYPKEYPDKISPMYQGKPEIPKNNGEIDQVEHFNFSFEYEDSRGFEEKSNLQSNAHQLRHSSHSCRKSSSSVTSNPLSFKTSNDSIQNEEISFLNGVYFESYPECLYAIPHNRRRSNDHHTTPPFSTRDILEDFCTSSLKSNGFCQLDEHDSSQTCSVVETDNWSPISVSPLDSSLSFTSTDSHDTLPSENNHLEDTV